MRRELPLLFLCVIATNALAAEPGKIPTLVVNPEAFKSLIGPDCSHCMVEAQRRKHELRDDDRVLCWRHVFQDGYTNDGAVPLRFFLNTYRVLSDGWGVFVYDPDAGYARGYRPEGNYRFHGWRNGVMVIRADDGTLYSGLTGIAFEGPKKGNRLQPRETLVTDWGFWHKRYPQALAYTMFDKYRPVELPSGVNEDSRKSRLPADPRLPADTMVLGVWDGKQARAYPLDVLEKAGVLYDTTGGKPRVIFWYAPARTAAAYGPAVFVSGRSPGYIGDGIFTVDPAGGAAPFVDRRTGGHWDITGRGEGGGPMLPWLDSVQVKWFAWAAEYPETSIYGGESVKAEVSVKTDYQPLVGKEQATAGAFGNLDKSTRHHAILQGVDLARQRVTLLVEGEELIKELPLQAGADVRRAGWWGRLDQFSAGERVWVWLQKDRDKQPLAVTLLADELSEQELYDRIEDHGAFGKRQTEQKAFLRQRWVEEGLPGTLVFSHPERREVELMLDHEAMSWGRSLAAGDKVTLQASQPIAAVVRQLRPWRERTQVLLGIDCSSLDTASLTVGQRTSLRLAAAPPAADSDPLPSGLGKSGSKSQRVEWLVSSIYCTCGMHDECAGHNFTLAACNVGPTKPCGLAKGTREKVAQWIDQGQTDWQIFDELLKQRGPKLLRPHMLP
jgi:hypothetical protein